jgi:NOL1/NOP2/sun family putative RNA methylase
MKSSPNLLSELPKEFLMKMVNLLGDEFEEFLASFDDPTCIGLRINTLKISPKVYTTISQYKLLPVSWCSAGFIVDDSSQKISPGKHPFHQAGLYYIQEPSAMAAVEILAPHPGEKVLDLAAAPGGKSTHLAALMDNSGILVANEIHPKRVWDLAQNLERCGITNAIITNETPQRLADHFGEYFDRVLLDAPCSGEGMFRKSESARREWRQEIPRSCATRQNNILEQAARLLKPGGVIVYSTCTFSPEENEGVIDTFLSRHPEFDIAPISIVRGYQPARPEWIGLSPNDRISRAIRIWPHLIQAEGHFIALLKKNKSAETKWEVKNPYNRILYRRADKQIKPDVLDVLEEFSRNNLKIQFDLSRLLFQGTYIYFLPIDPPQFEGIKIIAPGWWLGSVRKKRFIPSHALAMGMQTKHARQVLPFHLGAPQLRDFFSGQSIPNQGDDGWVLVSVDGFPVGWGKRIRNVVKNFYPHGLRQYT